MKKILSILLAMVMIVSSITVAFVAIAAAPIEENVEKINTQTAYIADAKNADGTTHTTPAYELTKKVDSSVSFGSDENDKVIKSILAEKYPEYSQEPYCNKNGEYNFDAILKNLVGVDSLNAVVKKNADPTIKAGRDAIIATVLDASKVKNQKSTRVGSVLATAFEFDDIDIVADERVEDSVLAEVTANYPMVTGLDDTLKFSAKEHETALDIENLDVKVKNISIKFAFDGDGRIKLLVYSYKIEGSADVYYASPEAMNAKFSLTVESKYDKFDYTDDDINLTELVNRINAGTANIVNVKAGYDYSRYSDFADEYTFTLSTNDLIASDSLIGGAISAVFAEYVDNIVIKVNKELGTDIHYTKWVCKNANGNNNSDTCTAKHPHQVWQCTCKDVDGCCTCCAGAGCTSTHPCDKKNGTCTSVDCKCGYIVDPECKYESSAKDNTELIDSTVAKLLTELGKQLDKSIGAAAKDQMKVGSTSANIAPADQKAAEKLDSRFAAKATQLDVFDIQEAYFDEDTGAIEFTLEDQNADNGYKSLSHLTNDYVTNEKFVEALKLAAIDKLGNTVEQLEGMFLNTSLEYTDITCSVKFVGATADNMYGTGEIERINVSYDCTAESEAMISYRLATHMDSTAKNVKYADYEKG
ncbi:MAG: hypothetical protein SO149_07775, partial [Candidatus Fimenecus sp.]|nr:hypothetical protein [Candidatus Fimenecus sp.]